VLKLRVPKGYRHPELDAAIRAQRVRAEARALRDARAAGVRTPAVLDLDLERGSLVLERVEGPTVRTALPRLPEVERDAVARALGAALGALHAAGMVHGDPTTSNFLVEGPPGDGRVALAVLDTSMGGTVEGVEERGVDLRLLYEAFASTHHSDVARFERVLEGYREAYPAGAGEAITRMDAIARRGRYQERDEGHGTDGGGGDDKEGSVA
jgi:Kae1-associated kinase Bud32